MPQVQERQLGPPQETGRIPHYKWAYGVGYKRQSEEAASLEVDYGGHIMKTKHSGGKLSAEVPRDVPSWAHAVVFRGSGRTHTLQ